MRFCFCFCFCFCFLSFAFPVSSFLKYLFCIFLCVFLLSFFRSRNRDVSRLSSISHFISNLHYSLNVCLSMHSNLNRAPDARSAWVWLPFCVLPHITRVLLGLAQVFFHLRGLAIILSFLLCPSFPLNTGPELGTVKFRSTRSCVRVLSLFFVITASPPSMRLLLSLNSCSFRGLLLN